MKKVCIIGASKGFGKDLAEIFSKEGFKVFNYSRTACDLTNVKNVTFDLSNFKEFPIEEEFDYLIFNAWRYKSKRFKRMKYEDFEKDINDLILSSLYILKSSKAKHKTFISSIGVASNHEAKKWYALTKAFVSEIVKDDALVIYLGALNTGMSLPYMKHSDSSFFESKEVAEKIKDLIVNEKTGEHMMIYKRLIYKEEIKEDKWWDIIPVDISLSESRNLWLTSFAPLPISYICGSLVEKKGKGKMRIFIKNNLAYYTFIGKNHLFSIPVNYLIEEIMKAIWMCLREERSIDDVYMVSKVDYKVYMEIPTDTWIEVNYDVKFKSGFAFVNFESLYVKGNVVMKKSGLKVKKEVIDFKQKFFLEIG